MSLSFKKRVRIIPDNIVVVKRQLEGEGKILVQVGQQVTPSDVIGRSSVSAGFRSIQLANVLSVVPKEVKKYLARPLGRAIYKGELLAYRSGGIFEGKKVIIAPTDGILELLNEETGVLKIKILPRNQDLPAAVFGVVVGVDHIKKEVFIKTQATLIFGLVGSGKIKEGYLKLIGGRGDLIDKNRILSQFNDRILVGGGLIYSGAFTQLLTFGVNGIITGGINLSDFKSVAGGRINVDPKAQVDVGIGILVTEGFGSIPIGQDIFDLLLSYNDKFVILEGNKRRIALPSTDPDSIIAVSKFNLPPGELVVEEPEILAEELKLGVKIRIIGNPYMGEQGQVEAIDQKPTKLPSEVFSILVTVATKSRKIKVPYSNLEII